MDYAECKVYCDGSHYIAIPYRPRFTRKRPKPKEELITVKEESVQEKALNDTNKEDKPVYKPENEQFDEIIEERETEQIQGDFEAQKSNEVSERPARQMTRKEYFEELFEQTKSMKKRERFTYIVDKMLPHFSNYENAKNYVYNQFDRKLRNAIARRTRLARKTYLADFNYFCTFTYDNAKHTEESFKKTFQDCLKKMVMRKGWKYAGVWERSPGKNRLHFHGLFSIPNGGMPGELVDITDYNTTKHKRQTTKQNTYFNERFGRTDFKEIESKAILGESIAYLTKYIEKTGEKIVYSKNLPQYFISDIMEEDIVCPYGQEDKKLLLFDDFSCWDEGCYMGKVSPEVIAQMRKAN